MFHNTSTDVITNDTSTLPYVTQTDFRTKISNTIKDLIDNFDDKHTKQNTNLKKTIVDQDAKFDSKFEKQLHTFSLQSKVDSTKFPLKLDYQDTKVSSFRV